MAMLLLGACGSELTAGNGAADPGQPSSGVDSGTTDAPTADVASPDARTDSGGSEGGDDSGGCGTSLDKCASCMGQKCCADLVGCLADAKCSGAWSALMTCRTTTEADLCYGHEFLGSLSGDAGLPVTACAVYGACNADCVH